MPIQYLKERKLIKGVFCVDPCLSAPPVNSVLSAADKIHLGAKLQKIWQVWQYWGSNLRVVFFSKEGYNLPFKIRPPLTRSPLIISRYTNPPKEQLLEGSIAIPDRKTGSRQRL